MNAHKKVYGFLIAFLVFVICTQTQASTLHFESATFKVFGNCELCKSRIESTLLKNSTIQSATWDVSTKMLTVVYNPHAITLEAIHKLMADAGHDTDKLTADDKVYKKIASCCKYRKKK